MSELDVPGTLSRSARAWLQRIALRIAGGFHGEVTLIVDRNGGVRQVRWVQVESGEELREEGTT